MTRLDDRRPDPGELLRRLQAGEKRESDGRLKVFLGYAPRVGKSLRMFDEGRRRKVRGQDVVVATLQSPVTPEIQAVVDRLEVIPQSDEGAIDLVELFKRHPQVCLIDGLAQSNPPGSRNTQRWQDVRDLLARGATPVIVEGPFDAIAVTLGTGTPDANTQVAGTGTAGRSAEARGGAS